MATYYIVKSSESSTFESDAAAYFQTHTEYTLVSGDIAKYCTDDTHETILKTYKFWRKNNSGDLIWMCEVDSFTPEDLYVGSAGTFRESLNNNFGAIGTQATDIAANITKLEAQLAAVATSGLASDIIETTAKRFVTDAQKESWNERLWVGTYEGTQAIWLWDENATTPTNVTDTIKSLLSITQPTKTSDLTNDSGYLTYSGYTSPTILYAANYNVTEVVEDSTYSSQGLLYKGTIVLPNCTASMIAEVVFSQDDAASGNYSQVNETAAGKVYYWSKTNSTPTIPLVMAYTPSTLTATVKKTTAKKSST